MKIRIASAGVVPNKRVVSRKRAASSSSMRVASCMLIITSNVMLKYVLVFHSKCNEADR